MNATLAGALALFFAVPALKDFWLPAGAHLIPGVRGVVERLIEVVYWRGVLDGSLAMGFAASAFWILVIAILRRPNVKKTP
jgi:hypothetical protein